MYCDIENVHEKQVLQSFWKNRTAEFQCLLGSESYQRKEDVLDNFHPGAKEI